MLAIHPLVLTWAAVTALAAVSAPRIHQGAPPAAPASAALEVTVPQFPNPTCPIMGKPISDKLFTDIDKGRIYICCKACIKKIVAAPDKAYQTAYPKLEKAGNTACPITGKAIPKDAPTIVLQGREIALCCEKCPTSAKAAAQVVLAKTANPKIVDVGNTLCPITGGAVDPNAFCLIGEQLVHLSSSDQVEEVRKDPKGTLAKAIESAAKKSS